MIKKLYIRKLSISWVSTSHRFFLLCITAVLAVACSHASYPEKLSSKDCYQIVHVAGDTCVPSDLQRIVVLGVPTMGDALALGVKPVGSILYFEETPPYLEGKLDGIEAVGTSEQPNLEKILSLKPDLIIAMNEWGTTYEQLSQIAPTVVDDWQGYPSWEDHFNFVAKVLDKTEEAEQVWSHYERRVQDLKRALDKNYQDLEISFVHICCGTVDIDLKNSFSGSILEDVGLRRPTSQDIVSEHGIILLSEERLPDIDGDILFVAATSGESEKLLEQLKQNPLWNQLKSVQQGRVYPVNYPTWRGGNPLAADAVIDDLFRYLVKSQES